MIDGDVIVVDGVLHGFDFRQSASGKAPGFSGTNSDISASVAPTRATARTC